MKQTNFRFIIRDDDINYFTNPDYLDNVYKNVYGRIKVYFGLIPYIRSHWATVPDEYWDKNVEFFIGNNKKLINYLKFLIKHGKIEIALHGYNHDLGDNKPESLVLGSDEFNRKIKKSKTELETLLDTKIKWYIPPRNKISAENLEILKENNLSLMFSRPILPFGFCKSIKDKLFNLNLLLFRLKNGKIKHPFKVKINGLEVIFGTTYTPQVSILDMEKYFCYAVKNGEIFCLAWHSQEVNLKMKWGINYLIRKMFYR